MNRMLVGTSRCDVPAREAAGGIVAPLDATRTAQRAVRTGVPMYSKKRIRAFHEPQGTAGILPADQSVQRTAGGTPAAPWRCPQNARRNRIRGLCTRALLALLFVTTRDALAERYLSLAEAQRVCFPQADQFEAKTIRWTPQESKAVEQKSGVKVRAQETRFWLARKGTNLLGLLVLDHVLGKHEVIEYAVALSPEGTVLLVELLEYREQYGGEIRTPKWRDQFKGKSASSKLKLNEDIYNISGATISCRNVTDGVRRVLATFEWVVRPQLLAAGRLPDGAAKP